MSHLASLQRISFLPSFLKAGVTSFVALEPWRPAVLRTRQPTATPEVMTAPSYQAIHPMDVISVTRHTRAHGYPG